MSFYEKETNINCTSLIFALNIPITFYNTKYLIILHQEFKVNKIFNHYIKNSKLLFASIWAHVLEIFSMHSLFSLIISEWSFWRSAMSNSLFKARIFKISKRFIAGSMILNYFVTLKINASRMHTFNVCKCSFLNLRTARKRDFSYSFSHIEFLILLIQNQWWASRLE